MAIQIPQIAPTQTSNVVTKESDNSEDENEEENEDEEDEDEEQS